MSLPNYSGRYLNSLILVLLLFTGHVSMVSAQATGPWTSPESITHDGAFASTPFLVADRSGVVHAVWSRSTLDPSSELGLDTVMYARLEGGQWSEPIDILADNEPLLRVVRLRIDQDDTLHLLAVGKNHLTYATAHVTNARTARGWVTSELEEMAQTADFSLGSDGTVHIVYALDRLGIYHIVSESSGQRWSSPVAIWVVTGGGYSSGSVRIEQGPDGVLHAVWGITSAETRWNPIGVAYARSVDGGLSWDQTLEVIEGDNQPSIGFDQDGKTHLVWNNPAGSSLGRGHVISNDSGATWSSVERLFPDYRGQTWWPSMIRDSGGTLHLITAANAPGEVSSRVFHSVWLGNIWSKPVVISGQMLGIEAPSIVAVNGNQLRVAWFSYIVSQYGIWTSSAVADAPYVEPVKIATATPPASGAGSEATPIPTEPPTSTMTPSFNTSPDSEVPINSTDTMRFALMSSVIPILLIIGLIVFRRQSGR